MSRLPLQSSYFSVSTFLSGFYMMRTAIALDIVRQYYFKQKYAGENVNTIAIADYGEFINFEELCLGAWMVFDKLYGIYPPDIQIISGQYLVGWNRDVTDPTLDIPIALKLYEQLVAPASSYNDKWSRMETVQKLFYKIYKSPMEQRFITPNHYDILQEMNPIFYQWILDNIARLEEMLQNTYDYNNIKIDHKKYVFDLRPVPDFFDDTIKVSDLDLGLFHLNDGMLLANKFYMSFLTAFEQLLHEYTKHIFPMKLYATIGYIYTAHMKILMDFLKPYHAKLIEKEPILYFGNDLFDSVMVGDDMYQTITQKLIDSIIHTKFDNTRQGEVQYDHQYKIREKINITII